MKRKWVNPSINNLDVKETTAPINANCNPLSGINWPCHINGPVWNDGEKEWQCCSMGQGAGVNGHLSDGDINKIPRCSYIAANNKTCLAGKSVGY